MFFGRTDAKAETPILWLPHEKSWLIGKDSDAGRDWGQEEKGMTEDEMAGWHHRLDGQEFGWTLGVGDGQGGLACCNSWGCKELDMTEWLKWTELNWIDITLLLTKKLISRTLYVQHGSFLHALIVNKCLLLIIFLWCTVNLHLLRRSFDFFFFKQRSNTI